VQSQRFRVPDVAGCRWCIEKEGNWTQYPAQELHLAKALHVLLCERHFAEYQEGVRPF